MKSRYLLIAALAAVVGGGLTASPAYAHTAAGQTSLDITPNPAPLDFGPGADVSVTTTTTSPNTVDKQGNTVLGHPEKISEGTIRLELAVDANNNPAQVPTGSDWPNWLDVTPPALLAPDGGIHPDANGVVSFQLDLDGLGFQVGTTGTFRAHYVTGGGQDKVAEHKSLLLDVTGTSTCSGLTIGATFVNGANFLLPGSTGPWTFRITLKNCTGLNLTGVKVQGGTSGWTTFVTAVPSSGAVSRFRANRKNEVITWTVDIPASATVYIDVTVDGVVPNNAPGTVLYLSGAWSAEYDHDNDAATPRVKTPYTGRVSFQVGPDPALSP